MLAFGAPIPVRDRYLQVAPGVTASMPLLQGLLAAEYEPHLRFFSRIPEVKQTSNFAGARLELPVGSVMGYLARARRKMQAALRRRQNARLEEL